MSLDQLFRRLGQDARDQFIAVINEASADDSIARMEKLDAEIDAIRRDLDDQFRKRESLKSSLASVESLLESIGGPPGDDLDVAALWLWLKTRSQDLKDRMAEIHPEEKLRRKLLLQTARDLICARRQFAQTVTSRMLQPARSVERAKKAGG